MVVVMFVDHNKQAGVGKNIGFRRCSNTSRRAHHPSSLPEGGRCGRAYV